MEESADGRGRDLVFRSLQVDDEGEYSCEAIIDGMNEKKIFYLKVIGKKNHSRNLRFHNLYRTYSLFMNQVMSGFFINC